MSVSNLKDYRFKLESINNQIFSLIKNRQSIIKQIQSYKQNSWDPTREHILFENYATSERRDVTEALIFSLLIEKQAKEANDSYPSWSQGEHLVDGIITSKNDIMNPILLRYLNLAQYTKLKLKNEFKEKIEKVIKDEI